jgi:hypothetical protein
MARIKVHGIAVDNISLYLVPLDAISWHAYQSPRDEFDHPAAERDVYYYSKGEKTQKTARRGMSSRFDIMSEKELKYVL